MTQIVSIEHVGGDDARTLGRAVEPPGGALKSVRDPNKLGRTGETGNSDAQIIDDLTLPMRVSREVNDSRGAPGSAMLTNRSLVQLSVERMNTGTLVPKYRR